MDNLSLLNGTLKYSISNYPEECIPVKDILSSKVIVRKRFAHPILGWLVSVLLFVIAMYVILTAIANGSIFSLFITRGSVVIVFLLVSVYLAYSISNSKSVPCLIIKTINKRHVIQVEDGTIDEVRSFVKEIDIARRI